MFPLHSLPLGLNQSCTFLVSNESPYFSNYNPKISTSIPLYFRSYSKICSSITFEVTAKYVPVYQFWFSYVFSQQPHPQCHILIFVPGEKIKATLRWNCTKCVLGAKVNQLRVKNRHVKMATSPVRWNEDEKKTCKQTNKQYKHISVYLNVISKQHNKGIKQGKSAVSEITVVTKGKKNTQQRWQVPIYTKQTLTDNYNLGQNCCKKITTW